MLIVKLFIMSWDGYIDNIIAQSKDPTGKSHVDRACIIGLDGGAMWTTKDHINSFKISPDEAKTIAKCFKSKDFTDFMISGVHCEGTYCIFLRVDEDKIVLAKCGSGAVTLQASKTAVIVAHCPRDSQQGYANKAVYAVATYLEKMDM